MWNKHRKSVSADVPADNQTTDTTTTSFEVNPKRPYLAAVNQLGLKVPNLRAVFDNFGRVRTLTAESAEGLFNQPMLGTPKQQSRKFLNVPEVYNALGLRHVDISDGEVTELPSLGYRITHRQEVTVEGVRIPVRKGFVQVYMDTNGKVFEVTNTLRYGRRNLSLDGTITHDQAIAAAKADLKFENYATERAELVFSSHNDKIDPVWEVVVTANEPRRVMLVLVRADNGTVVHKESLLKHLPKRSLVKPSPAVAAVAELAKSKGGKSGKGSKAPVMGKGFLRIPDPKKPIAKQVMDVVLENLLDPKVLATKYFTMYVGSMSRPVKAKSDGTFNYKPGDPEFSAVVTLFGLVAQFELYIKWGMTPPTKPIPVIVEDRSVQDNAYFDPEAYEIHIGIGTGLNAGGLNRYIAYDLGVFWHENGHHVVFLQTPGNDLPGTEGGAIHESIGDVLGDLLMDWWFRMTFGKQLGETLSVADVDNDRRVIGIYALPPDGIRIQKNTKKTPDDKTGEVHDDGLISGGAKADLLVGMIDKLGIQQGLEGFGRLTLAALAVVPAHRVTFRDLLNAYLTADQSLNGGANKQLITASFGAHGIKLNGSRGKRGGSPIIIVIG